MPGWAAACVAGATGAAAAVHPRLALAVFAALVPVVPAICSALLEVPVRAAEIVPAALALGLYARHAFRRDAAGAPRAFAWAVAAFVVVVITSVAFQALLTRLVLSPAGFY